MKHNTIDKNIIFEDFRKWVRDYLMHSTTANCMNIDDTVEFNFYRHNLVDIEKYFSEKYGKNLVGKLHYSITFEQLITRYILK